MDLQIKDRTALVLGGGGGLGGAIASSLAKEGVRVAVADMNRDAATAAARAIELAGGRSLALHWDLADLSSIDGNIARVEQELGEIDILVNNTGGPPPTTAHGQDVDLWRKHFDSMVLSVIAITDR